MPKTINTTIEQVPLNRLKLHPRNVNQGDFGAIQSSMVENGFFGTIVANKRTGHILAGNHRFAVAKSLHYDKVPVAWVDVDDEQELRILIADNRTTRLGMDDEAKLAELLSELANTPSGLTGTGYDGDDLDELIGRVTGNWDTDIAEKADRIDANGDGLRYTMVVSCIQAESNDVRQAVADAIADFNDARIED
jgi:hypothetical protein